MTSCLRGEDSSENETYEDQKERRRKRSIKKKVFAFISATPPRTPIKSTRTPSHSTDKSNNKANSYLIYKIFEARTVPIHDETKDDSQTIRRPKSFSKTHIFTAGPPLSAEDLGRMKTLSCVSLTIPDREVKIRHISSPSSMDKGMLRVLYYRV